MVMLGPVSVSMPSFLSKEQLTGAVGTAGGLIFSDYIAASLISRTGLTGGTALAGSAAAKIGAGGLLWYGATKTRGSMATFAGLASVGCFASVIIDVIRYVYPQIGGASARLGAAMMRGAPRVAVAHGVMLRAAAAPMIQPRAETPSAYALGGF